jgi:hypothetical protein
MRRQFSGQKGSLPEVSPLVDRPDFEPEYSTLASEVRGEKGQFSGRASVASDEVGGEENHGRMPELQHSHESRAVVETSHRELSEMQDRVSHSSGESRVVKVDIEPASSETRGIAVRFSSL